MTLLSSMLFNSSCYLPELNASYMPQCFSLLTRYADPRLAADIARLIYDAGSPLNPEPRTATSNCGSISSNEGAHPLASDRQLNGCRALRDIASRLDVLGAGRPEQPGDVACIAWLLHAASQPRSLHECAIASVRRAFECDISWKAKRLSDRLPLTLIDAIRMK